MWGGNRSFKKYIVSQYSGKQHNFYLVHVKQIYLFLFFGLNVAKEAVKVPFLSVYWWFEVNYEWTWFEWFMYISLPWKSEKVCLIVFNVNL